MPENHAALVMELYATFARYRATYPLTLCQCGSCMPLDEQQALFAVPLRELPVPWLQTYLASVPGDNQVAYLNESKYFLPRICELLLQGKELASLTETTLSKLDLSNPVWPLHERALLEHYARTLITQLYTGGSLPYRLRGHSANYLLMFHWTGMDLTRELADIWTAHAHTLAALRDYITLLEHIDWESGSIRWERLLHLPEYCPQRRHFVTQMQAWFAHPATRSAFYCSLEQALLQGWGGREETDMWESWYDWLGSDASILKAT